MTACAFGHSKRQWDLMIIDQRLANVSKTCLKRIFAFHTFQINVFHIFPSPNPYFGASWEETGTNQRYFPFFSYTFFFQISHPRIKISGDLGKNGIGPPLALFVYIFSYLLIQILKRFGKKWSWTPTEPAPYPFVTACVFGHSIRQWDLMELGSGPKGYVTNICCSKMLDYSNRHVH